MAGVEQDVVASVSDHFREDSRYCYPFQELDTSYKQLNFL